MWNCESLYRPSGSPDGWGGESSQVPRPTLQVSRGTRLGGRRRSWWWELRMHFAPVWPQITLLLWCSADLRNRDKLSDQSGPLMLKIALTATFFLFSLHCREDEIFYRIQGAQVRWSDESKSHSLHPLTWWEELLPESEQRCQRVLPFT